MKHHMHISDFDKTHFQPSLIITSFAWFMHLGSHSGFCTAVCNSGQYYFFTLRIPTAHKIFVTACFSISLCPSLNRILTCKQSSEVLTIRGDFDWQASSNGRKYLSASMKFAFGGAAVPSLGQIRRVINFSKHAYHSKLHFLLF